MRFGKGISVVFFVSVIAVSQAYAAPFNAEQVFAETCAACHGFDGAGATAETPDLSEEGGALSKEDGVLVKSIIEGIEKDDGTVVMPPFGGADEFGKEQARKLLMFLRENFGT